MKYFRKFFVLPLFASFCCLAGVSAVRGGSGSETPGDVVKNIGDVLIYIVPSTAFGMTLGARDKTGTKQFAESAVVTMGIVAGLKYTVKSRRPNGDPQSFPSGHTAIVVQSAEFMRKRYGWKYGLPAYVIAAFVGYSRAVSDEHYTRDILAGALFGFVSTYLITKPYHGSCFQIKADNESGPTLLYTLRF